MIETRINLWKLYKKKLGGFISNYSKRIQLSVNWKFSYINRIKNTLMSQMERICMSIKLKQKRNCNESLNQIVKLLSQRMNKNKDH